MSRAHLWVRRYAATRTDLTEPQRVRLELLVLCLLTVVAAFVFGVTVVAYVSSLHLEKRAAKATVVAFICLAALYKLGFLICRGMITRSMLLHAAVLVVPTFAGAYLGKMVFNRVSSRVFQWAVQALVLAVGVLMIAKGIRAQG